MYLAVLRKVVIDTPFAAAIAEDLTANPPIVAVPEVAEVSHEEVEQIFLEDAVSQIARNIENGLLINYYEISVNSTSFATTLKPVSIKSGVRASAPDREVVEVEVAGSVIGSVQMEV